MNKRDILKKIENIEKELGEIKEYVSRNDYNNMDERRDFPLGVVPDIDINYTLDDLFAAFGKKKQSYATRLKNTLIKHRIHTLEGFLNLSVGEVLELENVGHGTLLQTKKALARLGIDW